MGKKNNTSAYQHKKTPLITDMKRHKWLYLMVLPGVIWMIIFCYLPMGGLVMACLLYTSTLFMSACFDDSWNVDNGGSYVVEKWPRYIGWRSGFGM